MVELFYLEEKKPGLDASLEKSDFYKQELALAVFCFFIMFLVFSLAFGNL